MAFEMRILDWIQTLRTPAGDRFWSLLTGMGDKGIIWILLAAVLLIIPKTRRGGIILSAALCVDLVLCNLLLKNVFARIRPYELNDSIRLLIRKPRDFSFPSGHTAAAFTAVSALYLGRVERLWKPVLFLALLLAFSRLYLYVHYPTDILGGILVGLAAGYLGYLAVRISERRRCG